MRPRAVQPESQASLPAVETTGIQPHLINRRTAEGVPEALLLVEDDIGIRDLIVALLSSLAPQRYAIHCASGGDEALRELRAKDPSVIVLDLLLPGTNGFDVLRELKALKPYLLARVIVITAASQQTLADFPEQNMIHRLLRKPFDAFELVRLIGECGVPS
jgi:CheY-like chemotaxis protein